MDTNTSATSLLASLTLTADGPDQDLFGDIAMDEDDDDAPPLAVAAGVAPPTVLPSAVLEEHGHGHVPGHVPGHALASSTMAPSPLAVLPPTMADAPAPPPPAASSSSSNNMSASVPALSRQPPMGLPPPPPPPSLLSKSGLLLGMPGMTTTTTVSTEDDSGGGGLFDAVDEEEEQQQQQQAEEDQRKRLELQLREEEERKRLERQLQEEEAYRVKQQQQKQKQEQQQQEEERRRQEEQLRQQQQLQQQQQQQQMHQSPYQQPHPYGYASQQQRQMQQQQPPPVSPYAPQSQSQHYNPQQQQHQQPQQQQQTSAMMQSAIMSPGQLNLNHGMQSMTLPNGNTTQQQRQQPFYREHASPHAGGAGGAGGPSPAFHAHAHVASPNHNHNAYGGAAAATSSTAGGGGNSYYYGTQPQQQQQQQQQHPSITAGMHNNLGGNHNNHNNNTLGLGQVRKLVLVKPPTIPPLYTRVVVSEPMLIQTQTLFLSSTPYWSYQISTTLANNNGGNTNTNTYTNTNGGTSCWLVRRRFRHVVALEDRLRQTCWGSILPPRPDKHATRALEEASTQQSAAFALQRSTELEEYLNALAHHPVAGHSQLLRLFLGLQDDLGTAWAECSTNALTRLGAVGMEMTKTVAESSTHLTTAAKYNGQAPAHEWEDNAALLALSSSEQVRMGAVSQAVPKLEGTVLLLKEQGDAAGAVGMELSKVSKYSSGNGSGNGNGNGGSTNGTKELMGDEFLQGCTVLSNGLLRHGRRTKRLALELGAAMEPFLEQYKLVRYEKMALHDRRQALQRQANQRRGADTRAMYLSQHQRQLQATGQFDQLTQLERTAVTSDESALASVSDADQIGARLTSEIHRVAIERRVQWNASMKTIASSMKEACTERLAIWESTLEALTQANTTTTEQEYPYDPNDPQQQQQQGGAATMDPSASTMNGLDTSTIYA
jgi:hypothetical protein